MGVKPDVLPVGSWDSRQACSSRATWEDPLAVDTGGALGYCRFMIRDAHVFAFDFYFTTRATGRGGERAA